MTSHSRKPSGFWALLLGPLLSSGCVDSDSREPGLAGGSETAADGEPQAPYLDTVAAMHGALHLFWTNETTDCDAIEIERSTSEDFELVFSVDGDVEDLADDDATDPSLLYTYRLRCRQGEVYSPYSNEDARSPKPLDP